MVIHNYHWLNSASQTDGHTDAIKRIIAPAAVDNKRVTYKSNNGTILTIVY